MKVFDEVIRQKPYSSQGYLNKGRLLRESSQNIEALNCYDEALTLKPDGSEIYFEKAQILEELQKYEEALVNFRLAISLDPKNWLYYIYRGNLGRRKREKTTSENEEVLQDYKKSYSLVMEDRRLKYLLQ